MTKKEVVNILTVPFNVVFSNSSLNRNPVIRYQGRPIQRVQSMNCLGLILDSKLAYTEHIRYITRKCKTIFQSIRQLVIRNWGKISSYFTALRLFQCGVELWRHRVNRVITKGQLRSTQAMCLRTMLGTYRSTPNESLCILLAKLPPLHLHLDHIRAIIDFKRTGQTFLLGNNIVAEEYRYWVVVKRWIH